MSFPAAPELRFPGPLVSLEQVTFSYGSKEKPTLKSLSLTVYMGDRVGIVGLNGAGKSTLIKLLSGTTQPSSGVITRHPRLQIGYYSQQAVENLRDIGLADPKTTALSLLATEAKDVMDEGDMRGLLGSFGLQGRVASDVPIAELSGGQQVSSTEFCFEVLWWSITVY
jgi:ATPase subunit of ABC transporter with duplicated ATPase domains